MALIQCPECGKEISDKAQACPHRGKPMQEEKEYSLKISRNDSCNTANFFFVIAWILWIGGVIVAIVAGKTSSKYYSEPPFQWENFFTVLLTSALYGGASYCMGTIINYIYGIYYAIIKLELSHEVVKPKYRMSSLFSNEK